MLLYFLDDDFLYANFEKCRKCGQTALGFVLCSRDCPGAWERAGASCGAARAQAAAQSGRGPVASPAGSRGRRGRRGGRYGWKRPPTAPTRPFCSWGGTGEVWSRREGGGISRPKGVWCMEIFEFPRDFCFIFNLFSTYYFRIFFLAMEFCEGARRKLPWHEIRPGRGFRAGHFSRAVTHPGPSAQGKITCRGAVPPGQVDSPGRPNGGSGAPRALSTQGNVPRRSERTWPFSRLDLCPGGFHPGFPAGRPLRPGRPTQGNSLSRSRDRAGRHPMAEPHDRVS